MKWNGRSYRPGYGIPVYPKKESSIEELLKPLGEKIDKGNVWRPVLNQPLNVYKEPVTTPPVTPSITPTISLTPSVTPTITSSPTTTPTITPTPTISVTPTLTTTPTPSPSVPNTSASIVYENNRQTSNTTITFTGLTFTSNTFMVVAVEWWGVGTSSITSATLGGVTLQGNDPADGVISGSYRTQSQLLYCTTTGTTGSLTLNYNFNNMIWVNVTVYQTSGLSSPTQLYNNKVIQTNTSGCTLTTTGVTTPSLLFVCSSCGDQGSGVDWTYTPLTPDDFDRFPVNTPNVGYPGLTTASGYMSTSGNQTVTADINSGANIMRYMRVSVFG